MYTFQWKGRLWSDCFFHPLNKEGPAITVWDEVGSGYRVGLMADIFEKSKGVNKSKLVSTKAKK